MTKKKKIVIAIVLIAIISIVTPIACYYGSYCTVSFECGYYKHYSTSVKYNMREDFVSSKTVRRSTYFTPIIPYPPIIDSKAPIYYVFSGWYIDSALTQPYITQRIKRDMTLYGKWIEMPKK